MNANGPINRTAQFDEWDDVVDESTPAGEGLDLWGLLVRRKWLLVLGTVIGCVLGSLHYARTKPTYESRAQILIQAKMAPLPVKGLETQYRFAASMLDHAFVIRSPSIVGMAVTKKQLDKLPSLATVENPAAVIRSGLQAEPLKVGSSVFDLSYRGADPDDCAEMLDALVATYREFLGENQKDVGKEMAELITNAQESLREDLAAKELRYQEFQVQAPLFWKDGEATNIHQERQSQIEASRAQTLLENGGMEAKIRAVEAALERGTSRDVLMMMVGQSGDTSLSSDPSPREVFPLLLAVEELSQKYGVDHPKLKSLQRKIRFTRQFHEQAVASLAEEGGNEQPPQDVLLTYLESLREQLKAGQEQLLQLDVMFQAEEDKAKELTAYETKDAALQSDIDRTQAMFDAVVQRLQEISLIDDTYGENRYKLQVLSPAVRGRKVAPNLARIMLAAIALGALGGFGIAYAVERTDKTFRSPAEIGRCLRLPLVGHIPQMSGADQPVADSRLSATLCTAHRPKSPQAEAFRAIRTALYFNDRGQEHRIVQVTSPVSGDGKSTVCANLGITIAQSGKKVLILDGDFRRPTQHKLFGLSMDTGMASVVDGQVEPPQAIQSTAVPNLSVMACGPRPDNPSELLTSPQFVDLLALLRDQFDYVLVDTPPLLAVTDPSVVAARVDGVLFTLRLRKNGRPLAMRARDILADINAKVVGVVVNGVGGKKDSYAYGSYEYGSKHGYGYGDDENGHSNGAYFDEQPDEGSAMKVESSRRQT